MKGRSIRLSPARRLVVDLTRVPAPSVPVQKHMDISRLMAARAACADRPPWGALFTKAYSLVSAENPILRRAYVKIPWGHLYEYPRTNASFVIEREHEGEMIVLTILIGQTETRPVMEIADRIRHAKTRPISEIKEFRQMLKLARYPRFIRRIAWFIVLNVGRQRGNFFGTFGVTVYSGLGAESLHPMSPLTAVMNYGVISPEGKVSVRIMYDHRVTDGSEIARVLGRLEEKLNNEVADELAQLPQRAEAAE